MSIFMYNCIKFPDLYKPLSNCYNLVKEKHNYSTRNSVNNALSLPYVRTEKYKKNVWLMLVLIFEIIYQLAYEKVRIFTFLKGKLSNLL